MSSNTDKVIIVTGASRGMGLTIAQVLLKSSEFVKLVLIARSKDKLQEFVNSLNEKDQKRVHYVAGDLTDEKVLDQLIIESISKFNKINSVIFNAGILEPISHIDKLDTKQMRRLFEVNFFSLVELTQKLIPELRKSAIKDNFPSSCIYVSSSASEVCYDGWLAYGASKAAVNHLAMDLNNEEKGLIRSISIDPGIVDTGMQTNIRENLGNGMKSDAHQQFIEFHENGQLLKPEIPGGVCALLALKGIPEDLSGKYLEYCHKSLDNFQYSK
jgi:NAD(P)-dependent dehydrogenase (short-subunit alcohol dehydrogenase family)